jgi:hypothetical protein
MGNVDSACGFSEREELLHQIDMIELLRRASCFAVRCCCWLIALLFAIAV